MVPTKYFLSKRSIIPIYKKLPISELETNQFIKHAYPIPFITFGLYFDTDYVICLKDDEFSMIEICRTFIGNKEIWFTLESHLNGTQVAGHNQKDSKEANELFTFLPVKKVINQLEIKEEDNYLLVRYIRESGKEMSFKLPIKENRSRAIFFNGNAMNHSDRLANVSIYLETLNKISVKDHQLEKKMGIPLSFLISQKVFGISAVDFEINGENIKINEKSLKIKKVENKKSISIDIGENLGISYIFFKDENHLKLQKIKSWQKYKDQELILGELEFKDHLDDFRFIKDSIKSQGIVKINSKTLSQFSLIFSKEKSYVHFSYRGIKPHWSKRTIIGKISENHFNLKVVS